MPTVVLMAPESNELTSRIYGGAAGLDYCIRPDMQAGFALGSAGTNTNLAGGLGDGRSEISLAGVYGGHYIGATYIAAALAWGRQDVITDRVALLNSYRANIDASALSGRLGGGYRFETDASGVTPYAASQFTSFWLPGYAEHTVAGLDTFAHSCAQKDVTASRSELGLRADTSFTLTDALVTPRGCAAWAQNFDPDRIIGVRLSDAPRIGLRR